MIKIAGTVNVIPANFSGVAEYHDGEKHHFKNGMWHREGAPAIVKANGTLYFYKNGALHNENGPAIFYYGNMNKGKYYLDGTLYANEKSWQEEIEFRRKLQNSCNGKVAEIDGKKYSLTPVEE